MKPSSQTAPPAQDAADFIPTPLPVGQLLNEAFSAFFSNLAPFTLVSLLALSPIIVWGFLVVWDLGDFIAGFKIYLLAALIVTLVFGAVSASASALAYYRIKVHAEGADAEQLASVFD